MREQRQRASLHLMSRGAPASLIKREQSATEVMLQNDIGAALLSWYEKNGRSFAWRKNPESYSVLIAEILLKKTNAGVVDRFLPLFLERYPDIYALHREAISSLQETLSPLGLSGQRATQLKNLAKVLVESYEGKMPCNREELLNLPGVGDYTAGAILCFACNKPEPIVDTNVARVITRVYGLRPSRYEARRSPEVWEKAKELVYGHPEQAARINWALLDLGALVCRPKHPKHNDCPLNEHCVFRKSDTATLNNKSVS